jgi:predicted nucleotidyltransferase
MDALERERAVTAIGRALAPLPEVRAALLFGSRATGRARADSDVDVAVLLDLDQAASDERQRFDRLLNALASEFSAEKLDVVVLNNAPPALAFQVLKHGVVALERDRRDLVRFRVRTYGAHADYEPVERLFREATRRRALRGVSRG